MEGFGVLFGFDARQIHTNFTTYIELSDEEFDKIYNENIISVCKFIHTYDLKNMIRAMSEATLLIVALCESCARSLSLMSTKDRNFVESLSYIIENISGKIKVDDLARVAKMSRTAYFNYFLKETGQTPAVYIMNKRLELACSRLKSTDRSIDDIATDVGFCERAHLIKCFKKRYGITPTEYRKQNG